MHQISSRGSHPGTSGEGIISNVPWSWPQVCIVVLKMVMLYECIISLYERNQVFIDFTKDIMRDFGSLFTILYSIVISLLYMVEVDSPTHWSQYRNIAVDKLRKILYSFICYFLSP